ncbi:RNA polymerase sigma factor [Paenibacillus eucommiae]|uniref:RNA polymerase sigma-70 factor (ECF subfamily) n=1 Tax=Paenibacillus eucommiae TaxID=1355755 RepID=A0ABS4J1D0_9BACL|nr:sigma-70 family RNA polymerase sigma factor [Paenibacillus eucommiae]MBP1993634.1 RNA polymerase sigma-70 factor (ECF subfamily) [Paenibacillus eucommiae]
MDTEATWIKQIKLKSSQAAADALISSYYKEIYAYVYKQTMNKEMSMDLTQEIFISMLKSIAHFDGKRASFRTWLYKIATNRIVDYYRSKTYKSGRTAAVLDDELMGTEDFTLTVENKQQVEDIVAVVNRLDVSAQQIFRLKFFAEYTFAEISALLQFSESTVKTKYYAMIKKIKNSLEADSYGSRPSKSSVPSSPSRPIPD